MPTPREELEELRRLDELERKAQPQVVSLQSSDALPAGGAGEAAALGAADTLRLAKPLAPVSALAEKGIAKLSQLTGIGPQDVAGRVLEKPISELASETRQMLGEAEERHPLAFLGGQVAPLLPIRGPAATVGATIGGISGAAETQGGIPERLVGATLGAGAGALGGKLGEVAGQAVGRMSGKILEKIGQLRGGFGKLADAATRRGLGFTRSNIRKLAGNTAKADKISGTLREAGIFDAGTSPEAMLGKAKEIGRTANEKLSQIYPDLDAAGKPAFDWGQVVDKFDEVLAPVRGKESFSALNSQINKLLTDMQQIAPTDNITFSQARELKQLIGEHAFGKNMTLESLKPLRKLYGALQDLIDEGTERIPGQIGDELRQANRISSAASKGQTALQDKIDRQAGNLGFGVMDVLAGGAVGGIAAGATGEPMPGGVGLLGGIAARRGLQRFGPKIGAKVFGAAEKAIPPVVERILQQPAKMGKYAPALIGAAGRGQGALASTHYVLSQYPEYRELIKKASEEDDKNERE